MITWLRFLAAFLAFTLDVRVEAKAAAKDSIKAPVHEQVAQEPPDCLEKDGACALKTNTNDKYNWKFKEADVVLDVGTSALRVSDKEIVLLHGTLWVKAKSVFTVRTEYGTASLEQGEFWVMRSADLRVTFVAPFDDLILQPKGTSTQVLLPKGQQNWLGPVQTYGQASVGVPEAIRYREHLARWARLFSGSKSAFEKEVSRFREIWEQATQEAADYQQKLVQRSIASAEEAELEKQRRARAAKENGRAIRELFKKKSLLDSQ